MNCANCRKWLTQRVTDYEDSSRIINFKAPDNNGRCEVLNIETGPAFGCNQFEAGLEHIEIAAKKSGSPWHHSHYITCPDCNGTGVIGEGSCERCCRTGRCLLYDDGYIGEEKTRRHPNEAKIGPPPAPTCSACDREIDKSWKACPFCGHQFAGEGEIIRVTEFI